MTNNTVNLNGFLAVDAVKVVPQDRNHQALTVSGWIDTAPASQGGRHPFAACGAPAQVILDYARLAGGECSNQELRYGATLRAKLISLPSRSFLEIRHISFFDLSNPVCPGHDLYSNFVANSVTLQGHLSIPSTNSFEAAIYGCEPPILGASLCTDTENTGGRHSLLISGELAVFLQAQCAMGRPLQCQATVGGRLHSLGERIYVLAHYLSLQPGTQISEAPARQGTSQVARFLAGENGVI